MESKVGSVLLLISGIITVLISLVFLGLAIWAPFMKNATGDTTLGIIIFSAIFILLLVCSIIKFWASGLMKDPVTTEKGGIVALIVGILNSDPLSIIGGILGVFQGSK
ncbi:MAG: hypothetical protein Q7S74_00515 [Nanoarchaeota archaeon]|nr:hypothetical protein [Nanoarchaeota archaeon]